jgi:transcriptional regulator with XRE-family HTH domain
MSYLEIVKKALNGRTVNAAAKQWGVPQSTLDKYAKGTRLPDYMTAKRIAMEAGISGEEMFNTLAEEEARKRTKLEKISKGFNHLLRIANACFVRTIQTA